MKGIQFLVNIEEPEKIKIDQSRHVEEFMTEADKAARKEHWDNQTKEHPDFFDGVLGNLMDSTGDRHYISSNFSIYETLAVSAFNGYNPYSGELTDTLRSSTVTGSFETNDGYVIVQKIPEGLVGGGMIDPTCGGMVPTDEDGYINPKERMLSRLEKEHCVEKGDIVSLKYTGAHLAFDILTFTDMYHGKIDKTLAEVLERFEEGGSESIEGVSLENLEEYIIDHSIGYKEPKMVDDATATLLASLDYYNFNKTISEIKDKGGLIEFGDYIDGKFVSVE
jgi:hypothetical protein